MSVWKAPCYRDSAFQNAARIFGVNHITAKFLDRLLNFDVEDFGDHEVGENIKPGNLMKQSPNDIREKLRFQQYIAVRCGKRALSPVLAQLQDSKEVVFGLQAVYRIWIMASRRAKEVNFYDDQDATFLRSLYRAGSYIGKHTPRDADAQWGKFVKNYSEYALPMIRYFHSYLRIANGFTRKSYSREVRNAVANRQEIPSFDVPGLRKIGFDKMYPFPGLLILKKNDVVFVLTRDDTDRLEKLIVGDALSDLYYKSYGRFDDYDRAKMVSLSKRYREMILIAARKADYSQIQLLCRACDVAFYLTLARLAGEKSNHSELDQLDKIKKESLDRIIDVEQIAALADGVPIHEVAELLLYYKILPQADFDYFGAAKRQQDLYAKQNSITDEGIFLQVMRHHKLLMIKAYHARHGICPGNINFRENLPLWTNNYPYIDPANIEVSEIGLVNMSGAFIYKDHMLDCWDLLKDKAICPKQINDVRNQSDMQKVPKQDKNQLLDYIKRPEPVSVANLYDNWDKLFYDIKCDDKAEAKKPHGRWFMEAHTDVRLVLSEYEQSIADYGKHVAGFMQGKALIEKQRMMNYVTERLPEFDEKSQLFISLDIAKWSPRMPIRVHKELDKQWAEAFGMPHIVGMHKIFTEGNLHYIKGPIHHQFKKLGSDFEGFFGKKLTFYHLAVMHAAIDVVKAKRLVMGQTRYAAQIDDGVIRVIVDWQQHPNIIDVLRKELASIWISCGIEISFDKTFVSQDFVIFLNEIRYKNRAIAAGIRAFTKLTTKGEAVCPSLLDDLHTLDSTIRGAYVAGCTPIFGYFAYVLFVGDIMRKWSKRDTKFEDRHVVWMFSPVCLGGLGMCNLLSLLGSIDFDATQTAIGNLVILGNSYPGLKQTVNSILSQDIMPISDFNSVANPTAIRRVGPVLREDRLLNTMRKAAVFWLDTPVLRAFSFREGVESTDVSLRTVARERYIPVELRQLWYESTPTSAVDSIVKKVLTARTAQEIVPRRTLYRISVSNLTEARKIISMW